jgi:hypothetical protein
MLKQTEGVDIDLAQLEEIGKKDLQRNLDAMKVECDKFAPGMTLIECSNKASEHKAEGSDVVQAATAQLAELRKFIQEKDVVTVPGTEECKVAQAPPYKAWNFAYINIPGPYETNLPVDLLRLAARSEVGQEESRTSMSPEREACSSLRFTKVTRDTSCSSFTRTVRSRSSDKCSSDTHMPRAGLITPKEMMYDAGLGANDPELHIGQLQEALLRDVRFISAIGLHTKGMTVDESKKMFLEQGLRSEGEAEQQSARGTFDPAYLNYTMGKLMIKKLREDWTASRGGRSAWKQFHDAFLSYGGPPIPLVRKAMMGKDDKGSLF